MENIVEQLKKERKQMDEIWKEWHIFKDEILTPNESLKGQRSEKIAKDEDR